MSTAQSGDTVKVAYKGTLQDGTVFGETGTDQPVEFTIGKQRFIPGFEQAVVGMSVGEKKAFALKSDEAYGEYDENNVVETSRDTLPDEIEPEEGMQLQAKDPEGNQFPVIISKLGDDTVTLDANHPLAGKDLNFEIELVDIASQEQ